MRKRICNKVLLKFISVGAFFFGGGGGDGEVACLACFFCGRGGDGKVAYLACFFGGEVARLACSFLGWGGVGGWEGACLTYQEFKPFALLL